MLILRYKKIAGVFGLLSLLYLLLTALAPNNKAAMAKYHLSSTQLTVLTLAIIVPYLIIWFVALIGYLRFKSYANTIRGSKDGDAFNTISYGILWLTFWLPISGLISVVTSSYYRDHPSATAAMVRLNNYSNLLIILTAFVLIYYGSKKLLSLVKNPESVLPNWLMILFIGFSVLYTYIVLQDPARRFPTHDVAVASYYLSDWLIILTIIIPRLIVWFVGIKAVHNIYLYRKKIHGPIYKHALNHLATGLGWVIVSLIVLRSFQSMSAPLNQLSLGLVILVVYVLLVIMGIGYALIANGAKSLQLIEEI